jgi:hypothetical protein
LSKLTTWLDDTAGDEQSSEGITGADAHRVTRKQLISVKIAVHRKLHETEDIHYQAISWNFEFFAKGQFQSAVRHHMDQPGNDYRPGNSTTVSSGRQFEKSRRWVPQLQVNLFHKSPDQGALADSLVEPSSPTSCA